MGDVTRLPAFIIKGNSIQNRVQKPFIFNEAGDDLDFRIESDSDPFSFFHDATGSGKIGFGTSTPAEKLNVIGNFQVDDNATPTKGYRFRTTGTNLDLDAAAKDLFISTYTGAGFTGTQRQYMQFGAEFEFEKHYKKTIWDSGGSGDFIVFDKDGTSVFNEPGLDRDFRFEGDTDTALLFLDASADALVMGGTTASNSKLTLAGAKGALAINDGITAPGTSAGFAQIYVDTADGDLKVKFGDGTVKVLAADT